MPKLFSEPDQMNKQKDKGLGMKDKKSMTMKKGSDEECTMMMAAAREQREQMKIRGRKLGPVEAGPVIRK